MRQAGTCFAQIVLLLAGGVNVHGLDWELAYPESTATVDELPILSVGARFGDSVTGYPEYLVGSRSGYVMVSDFRSTASQDIDPVKLPVSFDIQAITSVDGNWILAGPAGQIAYQTTSETGVEKSLSEDWHLSMLPASESVIELASAGDNVIALTRDRVFLSQDAGATWREQQGLFLVADIEQFHGSLFAIRSELRATSWELELLRSENGESWKRVWDIICARSHEKRYLQNLEVNLMVTSDQMDSDGFPLPDSEQLYVFASMKDGPWHPEEFDLNVSSPDGHEWFDLQSTNNTFNRIHNNVFNQLVHWNPLGLPEDRLNYAVPTRQSGQSAGNLRISDNQLERLNGHNWEISLQTHPRGMMDPDTTTVWDTLSFIYNHKQVVSLSGDGEVAEFDLPPLPQNTYNENQWRQMVVVDGTYYTVAGKLSSSNIWELYPALRTTKNFIDWNYIAWPETYFIDESLNLYEVDNQLISTYSANHCTYLPGGYDSICSTSLNASLYDNGWIHLSGKSGPNYFSLTNAVYYPPHQAFYTGETYRHANGEGFILRSWPYLDPSTGVISIMFPDLASNDAFTNLSVPDGQSIVAFGNTSELLIVDPDGSKQISDLAQFFPKGDPQVNAVAHINGWNYVVGSALLRTKDFIEYEPLELANSEPMTNLVGYRGYLYGFTQGAVFRTPMDPGYLDSIEMADGWQYSDWLGWFQIIDQNLGDIDHLLLGTCWIKAVDDREYWLRTPELGWIMMIKDWSPWFWRLEDGHWYWLEQDAWPPQAFDYDDQEWIELKP